MTKPGDLYGQSLYDLAAAENLTDRLLREGQAIRSTLFSETTAILPAAR